MYCSCKVRCNARYLINGYPLCDMCCPVESQTDNNLIPKNTDIQRANKMSDEIYTKRFQSEADAIMLKQSIYTENDFYSMFVCMDNEERELLRFFYPFTKYGKMIKRIDPVKAREYDKVFSHRVITLILDFSAEPSHLSILSTKWRECFESPVIDLVQRESYREWRYYSRCLKIKGLILMITSLRRLKYIPLALEYCLDCPEYDYLLIKDIAYWSSNESGFIFTYRPDLRVKIYAHLTMKMNEYSRTKLTRCDSYRIFQKLYTHMKVLIQ